MPEPAAGKRGHRVTWFGPQRPVDGGTVFVKPPSGDEPPPANEPRYPGADLEFYGVRGSLYAEGGCVVFGHGRRALAAANAMARYEGGAHWRIPRRATDGKQPVQQMWATFHETCGCTAEDHDADHPDNDAGCDCDFAGLPPCEKDEFSWVVQKSEAEKPECLPIVEVKW